LLGLLSRQKPQVHSKERTILFSTGSFHLMHAVSVKRKKAESVHALPFFSTVYVYQSTFFKSMPHLHLPGLSETVLHMQEPPQLQK